MRIEIRATYWRGEGSDDVSVEMEFDGPTVGPMAMEQAVLPVLDRLITAPSYRTEPLMSADALYRSSQACECGHTRDAHQNDSKWPKGGQCRHCGSPGIEACASFRERSADERMPQ
jgi:hypothetical protein